MSPQLFASLAKAIDKWVEENCEDDEWPDVVMSNDTHIQMAKTSAAVLDAMVESQKYAIDNGYLKAK